MITITKSRNCLEKWVTDCFLSAIKYSANWQAGIRTMVLVLLSCWSALLWKYSNLKPSIKNGLLLGAASGLVGILAWKLMFKMHPNPPIIPYKKFYRQLLIAHCIFGIAAVIGYKKKKGAEPL